MSKLSARRKTWLLIQAEEQDKESATKEWANQARGCNPDLVILDDWMDELKDDDVWLTPEQKEPEENI